MLVPSVGRIVRFVPRENSMMGDVTNELAAIITRVNQDNTVNLGVWLEDGQHTSARNVPFDETWTKKFSWHWPSEMIKVMEKEFKSRK